MDNVVSKQSPLQPSFFETGAMVLIDKPLEWTSFDVVNKLRYSIKRHLNVKKYKVGHAGTLDPLATGLLILCFGKYTKQIESIVGQEKGYTAEITLGADTPSYDAELLPHIYYPYKEVHQEDIEQVVQRFSGKIEQLPPMFSAIKVKGVALYHHARKGLEIKRESRTVHISRLDIKKIQPDELSIVVKCSKGTYIRSLAYDIGQFLGTGGYLSALRRTQIGNYSVEEALTIDDFIDQINHLKEM